MIGIKGRFLRQQGLTLPEVLATMGVAAIMMTFALPSMNGLMAGYRLRGAASDIYGNLQMARMNAVKENNRFVFETSGSHEYSVFDDENNNGVQDDGEKIEKHDISRDYRGVMLTASVPVTFLPNGRAKISEGGEVGIVKVFSEQAQKARVIVITPGGAMRIDIPNGEGATQ